MLNITRTWNAVGALATMRRGIALARDYADRRVVFDRPWPSSRCTRTRWRACRRKFEAAFH
jgi:alkylation response protein AidB-like acyl-CoA dehydrogenase